MADKFFAVTRIKYGIDHTKEDDPTYSRHETRMFEPDDEVTGLPKEEMQKLWDAGALRRDSEANASPQEKSDSGEVSSSPSTASPAKPGPTSKAGQTK